MKTLHLLTKKSVYCLAFFAVCFLSGCGVFSGAIDNLTGIVGLNDTGTVIAKSAYIRSSYAVVAADLLEVKRGTKLEILEETEFEKVKWYRVRANDEDETEGWVEAQNIITGSLLAKSVKLAEESRELQPQAAAQLKAASNLRLTPEQKDDNLLLKLDNGSNFDIIGWKYVPKLQTEVDDGSGKATKNSKTENEDIKAAKETDEEDLNDKYDIWYKVRLDPAISPAPVGWLFGRQVILQIPTDIVSYQMDLKKFVTWQRLDTFEPTAGLSKETENLMTKPGSWVILTRSNVSKAKDGNEPDFDGILVLGYDKYNEEHYTAYRNDNVVGNIPLKVEGTGDKKSFTVGIFNAAGQLEQKRFEVFKDPKGRMKVTAPADLPAKPEGGK